MGEVLAHRDIVIHSEQLSLGAAAETLTNAGATIPENCGDVVVVTPSGDSLHWSPSVTPTSSLGRKITLGHPGRIPHTMQKKAKLISDDGSDVACQLIYFRGSANQILNSARSEPR
jgi:hypothetical protein